MQIFQTKARKLAGTDFHEVRKKAFGIYQEIKRKSKRKAHVRSAHFSKQKIFLDIFWSHLFEKKNFADMIRRMKLYPCAIELLQKSKLKPTSKENPNKPSEMLHRFTGMTPEKGIFYVQVKEDRKSRQKWLISIFPTDKTP